MSDELEDIPHIGGINHSNSTVYYPSNPIKQVRVDEFAYFLGVQFRKSDFKFCHLEYVPSRRKNVERGGALLHLAKAVVSLICFSLLVFFLSALIVQDGYEITEVMSSLSDAIQSIPLYVFLPMISVALGFSYNERLWFGLWLILMVSLLYASSALNPIWVVAIESAVNSSPEAFFWLLALFVAIFASGYFLKDYEEVKLSEVIKLHVVLQNGYSFSQEFSDSQVAYKAQRLITNVCNDAVYTNKTVINPTQVYKDFRFSALPTYDRYSLLRAEVQKARLFDRFEAIKEMEGNPNFNDLRLALFGNLARVKICSAPYRNFECKTGRWLPVHDVLEQYHKLILSLQTERTDIMDAYYPRLGDDGSLQFHEHDSDWRGFRWFVNPECEED